MVYLVVVSLFLHLVSFFIIVLLYQKIENQKPLDRDKTLKEMEDLLMSYTTEMKESNERLARRVSKLSSPPVIKEVDHYNKKDVLARENKAIMNKEESQNTDDISSNNHYIEETHEYDDYAPPIPSEQKDAVSIDSSDTAKVLLLNKQGYSVNEIAQKLHMGAGEVDLLLKFYK